MTSAPSDTPAVVLVRAFYEAMAAGDVERLFALLDPDVVVTQDPALPWGGRYVGHDGFATFGSNLRSTIASVVTIDAIFEADDEVVECGRTKGTVIANDAPFDIAEVHRWTIRDGRVVAAHFAIDTPAMLAALHAGTDGETASSR
jgi:ketosteroid isomerase-like protein